MGHVFSLDFPSEFNNWDATDPQSLFDAPTQAQEANPKTHVVKHLTVEAKGIDYLVLWLDCDREGENIGFEVMKVTKIYMNSKDQKKKDRVYRAHFSAITPQEIKHAMSNLGRPNENEAKAVDARQELDLKIGCAFTRFQTRFFQGKYGNLDSSCISFGPCQTPTIALCVKRHDEIISFVSEPFWTIQANVGIGGSTISISSKSGRIFKKGKAIEFQNKLKDCSKGTITRVSTEIKSLPRPHALNTVEMLKAASSGLGIGPQDAMHIAEKLYISGYISYPRTETSAYPKSFDIHAVLKDHRHSPYWYYIFSLCRGHIADKLLSDGFEVPKGGHDAGDHPPITPMRIGVEGELSGDSWRLYNFIARHFLGTILPKAKYAKTSISIDIGGQEFGISGSRLVEKGFMLAMDWKSLEDQMNIPDDLQQGQAVEVRQVDLKEGQTSPPGYLTESDLIGLMEKFGIGTDASMAVHIANIVQRRYVNVTGNRTLVPTNLGIVLIKGLQKIDPELADPQLRSNMEKKITLIANGKLSQTKVLNEEIEIFRNKFVEFKAKIEKMDELFEATFSAITDTGKPFSRCGKCRRYMHLLSLRPVRLHCRTCNETYSLPSNGTIKLYKELKCPLDNFELVLFSTGSKGQGYSICPCCYNNPPVQDMVGMGCNKCPNENCEYSMVRNLISACSQDNCPGILVLDATSAPRWKIGCNACNLVTRFNDSINHVKVVGGKACEDCGANMVKASFQKRENKSDIEGCVNCDEEFDELLDTRFVSGGRRRGGGRGRGRGRRGRRGRGRGRGRARDEYAGPSSSGTPKGASFADYF